MNLTSFIKRKYRRLNILHPLMKLPLLQPTDEYALVPVDFVLQKIVVMPEDIQAFSTTNIQDPTLIEHTQEYFVQCTEFI